MSGFTVFLIVLGAVSLTAGLMYFIMWLFAVCEGREW